MGGVLPASTGGVRQVLHGIGACVPFRALCATLGAMSDCFPYGKKAGERDAALAGEPRKPFNARWETITTDLTLS